MRAVLVYQIESYRHWQEHFGRDDFEYGEFGENFTVDGLSDTEVCIGDRYRIGEAEFEVTQPRVTCFRVGLRLGEPQMPALLVSHHRPGFYLRVIEEGTIAAGDAIELLAEGPERLTVAEIDGLLYLPNRSRDTLARALRVPALSEGWQGSFRTLLEQADQPAASAAAWPGFRPLRVAEVHRESDTISSFRLVPDDDTPVARAAPGQYLTLRLAPRGAGAGAGAAPVIRSYSLSAVPDERGYRISVKLEPGGVASDLLHHHVGVGDVLDAAAPRGSFVLRDEPRPVVLISAGVGVTPVLAMLEALSAARSARPVWWLHGARNRREQAFGAEADRLLAALPDARRYVCLSRPDAGEGEDAGADAVGRLGPEALDAAAVPVDADFYLCGPDAFMRSLGATLVARGALPEHVLTEVFGTAGALAPGIVTAGDRAPHPPDGPPGDGPAVTFTRSTLTVPWDDRQQSLLDFAEACDVPVSFGCRNGVCHSCESGLLAGEVAYTTAPLEPPADGRVLLCCARPVSEVVLEL
jgi:ferredoxin-NADP reductase/MOSC domain-containing protein YiiM